MAYPTPRLPRRDLILSSLAAVAVLALGSAWSADTRAATLDDAVAELQRQWEHIRYQMPAGERAGALEALAAQAHTVSEHHAMRPEALVWEGIIVSSWAAEKGGLGALSLVKQAKALYERAIEIDGRVLDGSAYNSLGVLYYKVPGWPLGFGDSGKARELLETALRINPQGIDPNFFYGEFLLEMGQTEQALTHLERALNAPGLDRQGARGAGASGVVTCFGAAWPSPNAG